MTFFGIELRKPSFNEITAATIMAVGLWVAVIGIAQVTGHGRRPDVERDPHRRVVEARPDRRDGYKSNLCRR